MSKEKSTNLRLTINVDLTDQGDLGIVRSLVRHVNVLSIRSKPRWCLQEIMTVPGESEQAKPGDKWAERKSGSADKLIPFPRFDQLNADAAARNNKNAKLSCIHKIWPVSACSICGKRNTVVTHSRDIGGPVINPTRPVTQYHGHTNTTYNWEEDRKKREAAEAIARERNIVLAAEQRMDMPLYAGLPNLVDEDGVVYDYEMW